MKKRTYYQLILDKSGSMEECVNQTISGFNEQVQMIKSLETEFPNQEYFISLTTFNHLISHDIICKKPSEVEKRTRANYVPDGMTALYDAIGESVMTLKGQIQPELDNGLSTVVVVIMTDGHENSSRIFTYKGISSMIKELEQTGYWVFSYMGATMDAVDIATSLNIKKENSMRFDPDRMAEYSGEILKRSLKTYALKKDQGLSLDNFLNKNDDGTK